jgi:hypothetical protein
MCGTELVTLEARAAEFASFRIHAMPVLPEDSHRAHLDADAAVVTTVRVNVDFKKDGGRGTDLHVMSYPSGTQPDEALPD